MRVTEIARIDARDVIANSGSRREEVGLRGAITKGCRRCVYLAHARTIAAFDRYIEWRYQRGAGVAPVRVPVLEAEIRTLSEQVRSSADEPGVVASSEARKQQLVTFLTEQVAQLEKDPTDAERKVEQTSSELQVANERRAALEETASRIPDLDRRFSRLFTLE